MAIIKQHIPAAVRDGRETLLEVEFNTLEELLAVPFVSRVFQSKHLTPYRLSLAYDPPHYKNPGYSLMVEYDEGYSWWVLGFIREKLTWLEEALPEWHSKYRDKE